MRELEYGTSRGESAFTIQGPSVDSGLHERSGFVEERAHHFGPVALARVVEHVLVRAIGLVRVDPLAKKVLDDLDLAFARPRGPGSNTNGRD